MRTLLRPLLIAAGTLSVALGIVGMFLPVLPTTPFLLLAAACYARSSDRFLRWLLHNRWFGAYIRNYREGRGMPLSTKVATLVALWATLVLSAAFAVSATWIRLLLASVGVGVTLHLLRIPSYSPERNPSSGAAVRILPPTSDES